MDKHIILTGFMGVGKSTVGPRVAERLGLPFIDLDADIARATGLACDFYIRRFGLEAFRKWERRLLTHALRQPPLVLIPGGGIVLDMDNRRQILQKGVVVWLKAPKRVLLERLHNEVRPLLTEKDRSEQIEQLLKDRWPYYQECHHSIETAFLNPDQVAEQIISYVQNRSTPSVVSL